MTGLWSGRWNGVYRRETVKGMTNVWMGFEATGSEMEFKLPLTNALGSTGWRRGGERKNEDENCRTIGRWGRSKTRAPQP